jgi:hypothetical protein
MKQRCVTNGHVAMDTEIKFRCDGDLRARLERLAIFERRNESDLARLIFEDGINQLEAARGLKLTHYGLRDATRVNSASGLAVAGKIVDAAAAHAATSAPRAAGKPVKYPVARRSKKKPTP